MNRSTYYIVLSALIILINNPLMGQVLTLKECYEAAESLSPLAQQSLYYESIAELKSTNARNSNLPSVMMNGQVSYQSDVFALPFSIPNQDSPEIPKEQYRVSLGVQQPIYNGGLSKHKLDLAEAEVLVNKQQVEVKLYQVREVVNRLFFGALIAQENEKILDTLRSTLSIQLKEVESRVENGVLLSSNSKILEKEILNIEQQLIIIQQNKKAMLQMLEAWIGQEIANTLMLSTPPISVSNPSELTINRPEMILFDLRNQQIGAVRSLTTKSNTPKISAFVDGGLGSPNQFNFFETDLSSYYIAGLRLQWNLMDWGSNKNDLQVYDLQQEIINREKDEFERQVNISMTHEKSDIEKFQALLKKDQEILSIQETIVKESYSQLKNGIITSTQYISEVNSEINARLNAKIHELSLIQAQVNLLVKSGNF